MSVWMIVGLIIIIALVVWMCFCEWDIVKQWLLVAVTNVEIELGSGTGQLKLLKVYEAFSRRFKIVSKLIPFGVFGKIVDLALITMRKMLEDNDAICGRRG